MQKHFSTSSASQFIAANEVSFIKRIATMCDDEAHRKTAVDDLSRDANEHAPIATGINEWCRVVEPQQTGMRIARSCRRFSPFA